MDGGAKKRRAARTKPAAGTKKKPAARRKKGGATTDGGAAGGGLMDFIGKATAKAKTESEQKNLPGYRWIPAVKGGPDKGLLENMQKELNTLREDSVKNAEGVSALQVGRERDTGEEAFINPLNHEEKQEQVMKYIFDKLSDDDKNTLSDDDENTLSDDDKQLAYFKKYYMISFKHVYNDNKPTDVDNSTATGSGYFIAIPVVLMRNRTNQDNLEAILKLWIKIKSGVNGALMVVKSAGGKAWTAAKDAGGKAWTETKAVGKAIGVGLKNTLNGCLAFFGFLWEVLKICGDLGVGAFKVLVLSPIALGITAAMDVGVGLRNSAKSGRMQVSVATTAMETGLLYQLKYASDEAKCKLKAYLKELMDDPATCDTILRAVADDKKKDKWTMRWKEDRDANRMNWDRTKALDAAIYNEKDRDENIKKAFAAASYIPVTSQPKWKTFPNVNDPTQPEDGFENIPLNGGAQRKPKSAKPKSAKPKATKAKKAKKA